MGMIAHPQKTAKIVYVFGNASYWGRSPSGSEHGKIGKTDT